MTRNPSPVYFSYSPDPSGRRPSLLGTLQYPSAADQAAGQSRTVDYQQGALSPRQSLGVSSYNGASPRAEPLDRNTKFGYQNYRCENRETRVIRGAGEHPSFEQSDGSLARSRAHIVQTDLWFCDEPGCPFRGPYINGNYERCTLGCGKPRSSRSHRETVLLRNR